MRKYLMLIADSADFGTVRTSDLCRRSLKLHVPSDQFLVAVQPSDKLLVTEVFLLPLYHSLYMRTNNGSIHYLPGNISLYK